MIEPCGCRYSKACIPKSGYANFHGQGTGVGQGVDAVRKGKKLEVRPGGVDVLLKSQLSPLSFDSPRAL